MRRAEASVDALVAGLVALVFAAFVVLVAGSALGLFARTPAGDAAEAASDGGTGHTPTGYAEYGAP